MTPEEKAIAEAKQLAENLAPVIKEEVAEWQKEMKEENAKMAKTIKTLEEDIAKVKTQSKKTLKGDDVEAKEKVGQFFKAFAQGDVESVKTLSEWVDADWGYLVPKEFHKNLVKVIEDYGLIRKYSRVIPMWTNSKDVSKLITWATAYVVGEWAGYTASAIKFGNLELKAQKFAVLDKATQELIDDNMTDIEIFNLVTLLAWKAIAELEDRQGLQGDWTWKNALGLYNNTDVNVYTLPTGKQSFEDVTAKDLIKIKNSVPNRYKKESKGKNIWTMSQDVFGIIEAMVDWEGRPLFRESLVEADKYTLLGYPVELNEANPTLADDWADTKFLCFGAFNFQLLGDRKRITNEMGYAAWDFEKDVKSQKIMERVALATAIGEAFVVAKTAA